MNPPSWLGHHWLEPHYLGWLLKGALLTGWLALLVCVTATTLGMLLTAALESRWRALSHAAGLWVSLHRNTPLMVQLLLWYFGVAGLLPETAMLWLNTPRSLPLPGGLTLPWPSFEFLAALVGLTLYSASFICGELQAGLRGVAAGQRQAARALGMNGWQEFRWVVLPQAWALARRPLVGQYTAVVKNTSLAMAIGVAELSYTSRQVETETLLAFQAFAVATAAYLLLVLLTQALSQRGEPAWRAPQ
ncbi:MULTISPECIES: amino acid ABC transporter permease [Chromobacterium]|uniref:Amino acid ABC transporter permease n=1 Tax=Chromobacterium rhizoryzae TaxID=1778675 RepID=A0AAD0RU75_9NEIS|nr:MULTISPECIES: amino acid ABC transporter permease [Chromobacterium]AXT47809.1 amino acid ABC transporter permease [Chromobacterium rhizoryzae]QOD81695.1 amino acid ABC transporter permease [Chromobacterium haemolyticum]